MMLAARFDLEFVATGEVVTDIEALARGVMAAERWPVFLEAVDNDELLGFLLGEAVVLERRYCRRDGIEARPWLFQRLRYKARDWRDAQLRHRTLPELHAGPDSWDDDLDRFSGVGDRHVGSASDPPPSDRGDTWVDALRGLLESGDRALLREVEALGLGPPPGARGSSEAACRALARLERRRLARVRAAEARDHDGELVEAAA